MTEPREPEPVPEGESVQPQPNDATTQDPRPDTGNWHPVGAEAPEPPVETPVPKPAGESSVEPVEPTTEPLVEPVETTRGSTAAEAASVPEERTEAASRGDAASDMVAEPDETPVPERAVEAPSDGDETSETVQLRTGESTQAADGEATVAQPAPLVVPDEPVPPRTEPTESIFRTPSPEPEPTRMEPVSEEEQKLAAERAARREARAAALAATAPVPVAAPAPVIVHKRTNDRFWGSLGLFLLRLALAAIFTVRGLNLLTDIPAAQAQFDKTILAGYPPGSQVMVIVTGVACLLIALSLLLGLLTRVAGLGIVLIAGGALAFVYWGPWSPFVPGQPGFLGEYELLLAVVGILLLCIGGGGWSLDRSFRAGRERDKAEKAAETE